MLPVISTNTEKDPKPQKNNKDDQYKECPGCKGHLNRTHKNHTRIPGKCRFPFDVSEHWECPACKADAPAGGNHTYELGKCRQFSIERRGNTTRTGKHPREPAKKATNDPTTDMQAQLPDGSDLGAADEAEASKQTASSAIAPPSDSARKSESDPYYGPPDSGAQPDDPGGSSSSSRPPASGRGPDQTPRVRTTVQDAGTGESVSDWSRFNVTSSLRALRSGKKAVVLKELRKMHLRWWHAPVTSMTNILKQAGIPTEILNEIPNIINTSPPMSIM